MSTSEIEYGLSIGSNLGDRLAQLKTAKARILGIPGIAGLWQSSVYETDPVGVRPEYAHIAYLNAVVVITSTTTPSVMSTAVHAIEAEMGRVRGDDRFAPRPIDIDILYAGDAMSQDESLTLPHPRWAERRFVVQPLAELRPDLVFPGDKKTVGEILSALPDEPGATPFTDAW
jgi:2-amino-4-hydroxy-6-hydroxymethyldihydropteridine diphosphokinase